MSLEVDYLPFATSGTANVDPQGDYQGSGYQENGWGSGLLPSKQLNKPIRQSSMVSAAVANFISNVLNIPILDDGNLANLITNFTNAIAAAAQGSQNRIVSVAFSANPVFDASQGSTFEIVLTGNVTGATLVNVVPGQRLIFIVKQDGTGGRAFTPPANLPMAAIASTVSATNIQAFIVDSGSNVYVDTPLIVQ